MGMRRTLPREAAASQEMSATLLLDDKATGKDGTQGWSACVVSERADTATQCEPAEARRLG